MTNEELQKYLVVIFRSTVYLKLAHEEHNLADMVKYSNAIANAAMSMESAVDRLLRQSLEQQQSLYERLQHGTGRK